MGWQDTNSSMEKMGKGKFLWSGEYRSRRKVVRLLIMMSEKDTRIILLTFCLKTHNTHNSMYKYMHIALMNHLA